MVRFQKRRRPGTCLGQPEPGATHMVPQHLVYKADQLLRRALDLAQEPVLHNTYQRAHIELGQHGELLLPSLIPQLRDNQTDRALDNSTDIRLEEPLQVVPTHRAKGAEAERTILLQVLEKLEQFPDLFEAVRNVGQGGKEYRKFLMGNYVGVYRVQEDEKRVIILRIFHGSQNYARYL